MPYVQNPEPAQPPSLLRRFLFPLVVVLLFGSLFAIPSIWDALEYPSDDLLIPFMIIWNLAVPLGTVLLLIWWLFFSGFTWLTRIGLVVLLGVASAAFVFTCVREVELKSRAYGLAPRFHFVWEPSPEDMLAKHLELEAIKKGDALTPIDATIGPEDYPSFRGPKADGVVAFANLRTDWKKDSPTELWRQPCPGGYSGIAVAGNIAVTMRQHGDKEIVVCYDRASGRERWTQPYGEIYKDSHRMGNGPRATPTIHDGHIFALGAMGDLVCLNVEGKVQWKVNVLDDNRAVNTKWGLTGSPLIVDDLVIVNPGINPNTNAGQSVAAYELKTGIRRWALHNRAAGYASPQLATLDGTRQILIFDAAGLMGLDSKTGVELWSVPWETKENMNMMQPVLIGDDRVFISSETDNGCAMLRVKNDKGTGKWSVETVWENRHLAARFANPVSDGKHIYGLHYLAGELRCLDVEDGKLLWRGERQWPGQLLLTGDTLLVVSGKGMLTLFATGTPECTELARQRIFEIDSWNTPAFAGHQLFLRNQEEIVCLKMPRR